MLCQLSTTPLWSDVANKLLQQIAFTMISEETCGDPALERLLQEIAEDHGLLDAPEVVTRH